MTKLHFDLLLAGGERDPSVMSLKTAAQHRGISVLSLIHGRATEARVSFEMGTGNLLVDGVACKVKSAFCRFDVFGDIAGETYTPSNRSNDWFAFASGVIQVSGLRHLNANARSMTTAKLVDLAHAAVIGLPIPLTFTSNDYKELKALQDGEAKWVAKPVGGGTYCYALEDVLGKDLVVDGKLPNPAIVQERLGYPEYRLYRIGRQLVLFEVSSAKLDYRSDTQATMVMKDISTLPGMIQDKIFQLGDSTGLDFYACDMKHRESTGELCFLELNTSPMFAAHDAVSNAAVSNAILNTLLPPSG